jgi:hypothetical protein
MLGQMKKSEISGFMAANMKMTDSLLGSEWSPWLWKQQAALKRQ